MDRVYEVNYAGIPIRYQFRNNCTSLCFARHIHLSKSDNYDIRMNDEDFELFRSIHSKEVADYYVEYKGMLYLTSGKLLSNMCCFFHAVSFCWKEKAWLLTGKSGTGKTTQYLNWNHTFPDEITMISGDMPLLDFRKDQIYVHASPWNGKEKIGNMISAKLGGIVILRQENYNSIKPSEIIDSIHSLFRQFIVILKKEEEIQLVAEMVQMLIERVPVWILENDGTENSTRLLRKTLLLNVEKENCNR